MGTTVRRQPVNFDIPKSPDYKFLNITNFRGLDVSSNPFELASNTASDCLNVYVDETNTLTTRPRLDKKMDAPLNGRHIATYNIHMAIHPDDPPYPIFGLPRIITCEENLDRFLAIVDSPANSLCLCTGSLGCARSNDIVAMVRKYSAMDRIAFMHIRNVLVMDDGSFEESGHLSSCGSIDMYEIVKALVLADFDGYVRPDHGRMIWGETGKPGYGLFDRALGATYINGLFEALEKEFKK